MTQLMLLANVVDSGHMSGVGWAWMGLWMVVGIIAVGVAIDGITWRTDRGARSNPYDSALSVLSEMYAKGEIDEPEFRHRRSTLSG